MIYTYQDFLEEYAKNPTEAVYSAVLTHMGSPEYRTAIDADAYDRQQNTTIMEYQKTVKTLLGNEVPDLFAANNKIPCNFFRRLNTQRNEYLLGNGVYFDSSATKKKLGTDFDTILQKIGYAALIHSVAFGFWTGEKLHCFKLTEFAPLYDEMTGALMAGIRFWRVGCESSESPLHMWLYALDGVTKFVQIGSAKTKPVADGKPEPYIGITKRTPADGEELIGGRNYPSLPIVPLWGSELKQSTLVGLKNSIDCYDLIRSGFANDLSDAAYIYWLISGADGMDDTDKQKLLSEIRAKHIAVVSGGDGRTASGDDSKPTITPYTQDVPYEARTQYLDRLRSGIYEDFGALDVSQISATAKTATEIRAAYQPLDENADDYEYQVLEFMRGVLALLGIDDVPTFRRNRVTNELEQMQVLSAAAAYLDKETIVRKLPFLTVDEIDEVLKRIDNEDAARFGATLATDATQDVSQTDAATDSTVTESDVTNAAEQAASKTLNGAQTQSLITVIGQYAEGTISLGQAVNIVSVAIGVTKEEAQNLIEGAI